MSFDQVVTLVATPPHPGIEGKWIQQVLAALQETGASTSNPFWLSPNIAVDLYYNGPNSAVITPIVESALEGSRIDALVQPRATRRKKMLLADMDSTIIQQECLDELADYAGIKAETAAITERAMRGELDFKDALRERVAKLKGMDEAALHKTLARLTLMPGAQALLRTMRGHGAECHLVSGGFRFFTGAIAKRLDFSNHHGNDLLVHEGKLTGEVAEPILDKNAKLDILYRLAAHNALSLEEVVAVGDGANDIPMLQAAGLGVALHAKPKVNEQVRTHVRYSDLTALLYAQGYTREDVA